MSHQSLRIGLEVISASHQGVGGGLLGSQGLPVMPVFAAVSGIAQIQGFVAPPMHAWT